MTHTKQNPRDPHARPPVERMLRIHQEIQSGRFPNCRTLAGELEVSTKSIQRDLEFRLQGNVFTRDVISTWIWYKREKEVDAIRLRPHPYEFALYYDI